MARDLEDNAVRPVAPGRQGEVNTQALDQLTKAITRLQDTIAAQNSTSQGAIINGQNAIATSASMASPAPGASSVLLPPPSFSNGEQGAREALQEQSERNFQRPGETSPYASRPPDYYEQAALGPLTVVKGALKARKEKRSMFEGAFNQRKTPRPEPVPESSLNPDSMAPDARVSRRGPEMDQEEAQSIDPDNPNTEVYQRRNAGRDRSGPSGIASGISQQLGGEISEDQLRIPQYGDWQLDTKLRMARDIAYRMAERRGGEGTIGTASSRVASIANYGYAHAAQYQLAKLYAQKGLAYGEGVVGQGTALGYSPQGMGGSSILGFRNPLSMMPFGSPAAAQGAGMNFDAMKLSRLGTGLSTQQAKEAYEATAAMGFSNQESGFLGMTTGGDLNNIVNGFMAPRMREGASAQALAPFTEMLKPGNISIKELSESIKGLGDAAKATHQTVDESAASLQSYISTAIEHGATNLQGANSGKGFEMTTGLPSTVLGSAMGSTMYQAAAMAQTGVLPQNIGTLPAGAATEVLLERAAMLKRGIKIPGVHNAKGEEISSSKEQTDAWIAQNLGLTHEQLKSLETRAPKIKADQAALTAMEPGSNWNKELSSADNAAKKKFLVTQYHEALQQAQNNENHPNSPHTGRGYHRQGRKTTAEVEQEWREQKGQFAHDKLGAQPVGPEAQRILQEGGYVEGHYVPGKKQTYNNLWKAGASKDELHEFWNAKNQDTAKVANRIIAKRGSPDINQGAGSANVNGVTIGLTPEARKVLKITGVNEAQRSAYAGGPSTAGAAAQPLGPSSTIPAYGNQEG